MNNNRRKKTTPLFALLFGWMLAACSDDLHWGRLSHAVVMQYFTKELCDSVADDIAGMRA